MSHLSNSSQSASVPRVNLRVNEFCEAYGIGRTTFYEEVKAGGLRVIKVGKRTLVPATEAEKWQSRKIAECAA